MHPYLHAQKHPEKPACIFAATGEVVTYRQLDERSNQGAHVLRSLGLKRGDVFAVCMENQPRYLEIAWSNQRAGLYMVCISTKLTAPEVEYILKDCGAKLFITSAAMQELAERVAPLAPDIVRFMVGRRKRRYQSWDAALADMPATPVPDQSTGADMLYSSGTTGRPKGVKFPLSAEPIDAPTTLVQLARSCMGSTRTRVYLSPAPLYHAAPLRWCLAVQQLGGTGRDDGALRRRRRRCRLIERYPVTHAQWVPTHFVRFLRLPSEVRTRYDLSSLTMCDPCSGAVSRSRQGADDRLVGTRINEYYAGTEGNGMTAISCREWLERKGSVGRAVFGEIRVCDDEGEQVGPMVEGVIYFAGGKEFEYHNAPEKTCESRNAHGWSTLGDVGYVDQDGYLFLTDRKAFMIISGGVNIYPQEIENLLITHPPVHGRRGGRRTRRGNGREGRRRGAACRSSRCRTRACTGTHGVCARTSEPRENPSTDRLHDRAAATSERQALQAPPARCLLGQEVADCLACNARTHSATRRHRCETADRATAPGSRCRCPFARQPVDPAVRPHRNTTGEPCWVMRPASSTSTGVT